MEVLKNCQMQGSDEQEKTYNCRRLLGTSSPASTPRSAKKEDVGFLLACKDQLSSEVIKWKTETLRLQQERDKAQQRVKELDQLVLKQAERTKDLENQLLHVESEKHARCTTAIEESKAILMQKLNQGINKYNSFPSPENSAKLGSLQLSRREPFQTFPNIVEGDWREVTQQMLRQMRLEMKEMQEMTGLLCVYPEKEGSKEDFRVVEEESTVCKTDDVLECREDVEEGLTSLLTETDSLKYRLLEQRQKLESLCNSLSGEIQNARVDNQISSKTFPSTDSGNAAKPSSPNRVKPVIKTKPVIQCLNQQLSATTDSSKAAQEMQHFLKNQEKVSNPKKTADSKQPEKSPVKNSKVPPVKEDRVCPICQKIFNSSVPQMDFEEHVVNHLETESTSLLDQYVVV